jgi:hypothetical protein
VIAGVIVALAAGVTIFVLAPLRGPASPPREDGREPAQREETALDALRDIELDRATGKLNEDDYADLRARYEARAGEALRRRDGAPDLRSPSSGRASVGATEAPPGGGDAP